MCWSQPTRVDHLHKKWRVERKKISRKMGTAPKVQVSTRGQPATSSRPPAAGRHQRLQDRSNFFEIFLFKKKEFLEVWVMG
jgi:hypothetical protein